MSGPENTPIESTLQGVLNKLIANQTRQLEAFHTLHGLLRTDYLNLDFHGWPISPDVGRHLVASILEDDYDAILEFGSGTSTVLLARALRLKYADQPERPQFLSFDHSEKYHARSLKLLNDNDASEYASILLAPIKKLTVSKRSFWYYDCVARLEKLAESLLEAGRELDIFVFVDGPPEKLENVTRFPILPILLAVFERCNVRILLDDSSRESEKLVIRKWRRTLTRRGIQFADDQFNYYEKGLYSCSFKI